MENISQNIDENLALLEYYQAIGINMSIGEKPNNRFARKAINSEESPTTPKIITQALQTNDRAIIEDKPKEAKKLAAGAKDLTELEKIFSNFDGCALKKRATQLVFSDGNFAADIMIIGEAPSRDDDIEGKPFVGKSGLLLDKMLSAIGLDRNEVYLTNIVAWRPPGDRNPTNSEISACLPFLQRQIELVAPKIILSLGAPVVHCLFNNNEPITKLRGKWLDYQFNDLKIKTLPTFHPTFLLRQPAQKAFVWQDMLALKAAISEISNSA